MKSIYKKFHLVLVVLFVLGILYSGYILYNLPASLEKVSARIDLNAINEAQPVITEAYTVIGLTLLTGFVLIIHFLYILNMAGKKDIRSQTAAIADDRTEVSDGQIVEEIDSASEIVREIKKSAAELKDDRSKNEKILARLCMKLEASQGIYYTVKKDKHKRYIEMQTSFAFSLPESETLTYEFGEGLAGQVAKEGKKINISNVPEGYIKIISGLGNASPSHLLIYPIMNEGNVVAVAEIASFREITGKDEKLIAEVLKVDQSRPKESKKETSPVDEQQKVAGEDKKQRK